MTTCKFVGDASLKNDSFIHSLCDLLTFENINNGANLQLPLDTRKQKDIQLQRGLPPPLSSHRGLCPLDPHWGLRPQTPVNYSRAPRSPWNLNPLQF